MSLSTCLSEKRTFYTFFWQPLILSSQLTSNVTPSSFHLKLNVLSDLYLHPLSDTDSYIYPNLNLPPWTASSQHFSPLLTLLSTHWQLQVLCSPFGLCSSSLLSLFLYPLLSSACLIIAEAGFVSSLRAALQMTSAYLLPDSLCPLHLRPWITLSLSLSLDSEDGISSCSRRWDDFILRAWGWDLKGKVSASECDVLWGNLLWWKKWGRVIFIPVL